MRMENIVLEDGLDLRQLVTQGSVLRLNEEFLEEPESEDAGLKPVDFFGQPIKSFQELEKKLEAVDDRGYVKKKIFEEGGGVELDDGCTVSIAYSAYWENETEPFDVRTVQKPMVVDLKDHGLLPGVETAVRSMLVGEESIFLLSYQVMYGAIGVPPRIKPKANCIFYIKLVRSILTPQSKINYSEPNMFQKVLHEAKLLHSSGIVMFKNKNFLTAAQLFRKAVFMLHKCRLANGKEEKRQEMLLIKLYTNLAICYNKSKQPLRACTACNEINRLRNIWCNGKVLFQNAKALRMIGDFEGAKKRILRALHFFPDSEEMQEELALINKTCDECNKTTLIVGGSNEIVTKEFKEAVDTLIKVFKSNDSLCKLTLPAGLGPAEVDYVKEACNRENVFFSRVKKDLALDKDDQENPVDKDEL